MRNVKYRVEDTKLIITVDLAKDYGESRSGKTISVATTGGNVILPGIDRYFRVGVNVFRYKSSRQPKPTPPPPPPRTRVRLTDIDVD